MALCLEPTLQHKDLGATLAASIPAYTLTPDIEPEPHPKPKLKATLGGTDIVRGGIKGSVASGSVRGAVVTGSLRYAAVSATLRKAAFTVTLTSPLHPKSSLSAKAPVNASLTLGQLVGGSLTGNTTDAYLVVSCPIDYITSCYSLGGWDDNMGWDNEKGWKD